MLENIASNIRIVEVGPRDGLQNECKTVSVADKLKLIHMLEDAGLESIEVGAFVSPKWVPQMANTKELVEELDFKANISYPVLVPNLKGLEMAIDSGIKEIAIFAAASDEFSLKNINCSIDESLNRFEPVIQMALENNIKVRGYLSCVISCPYAGEVKPEQVRNISKRLIDMGCYEISLGDTIGVGTPLKVKNMLITVMDKIPPKKLAVHFHDSYGQALANILVAIDLGIATIDSSVAGLGGCPYAKGASGNVATEDVLYMLNGMGVKTGIDIKKLSKAGKFICEKLGIENQAKFSKTI